MSHGTYHGWRKWVLDTNGKMPFLALAVIAGLMVYTAGVNLGYEMEWMRGHFAKKAAAGAIFIFFCYVGAELHIREIIQAGRFVLAAMLGGMAVPPLVTYALVGDWWIALGASATDVAFSVSAGGILATSSELVLLMKSLMMLAVGDDLGGVAVMALVYAHSPALVWLAFLLIVIGFSIISGQKGWIPITLRKQRPNGNYKYWTGDLDIRVKSITFWVLLALANTYVCYMAGVEWVLGGCLVLIFATETATDQIAHRLAPYVPLVLIIFGFVSGAINLLNPENWGPITWGCLVGGMGGKHLGIFGGGLIGRWWARKKQTDKPNPYARIPMAQIFGLAMLAAVNGTVAIFFVQTALANGRITEVAAAQAILGFFLTVPAVYVETLIMKKLGFLRDVPGFMPEKAEEIEII